MASLFFLFAFFGTGLLLGYFSAPLFVITGSSFIALMVTLQLDINVLLKIGLLLITIALFILTVKPWRCALISKKVFTWFKGVLPELSVHHLLPD